MTKVAIFWFRRDLRLYDNTGLWHALNSGFPILPIFIFDSFILSTLNNKFDARVTFIHNQIKILKEELKLNKGDIWVEYGNPIEIIDKLINLFEVKALFTNKDYEPYAIHRDEKVKNLLNKKGISFHSFKDQVIFEEREILSKSAGTPYTVFTPYSRSWKEKLKANLSEISIVRIPQFSSQKELGGNLISLSEELILPTLNSFNFEESLSQIPPNSINEEVIKMYSVQRDYPFLRGTSKLGLHLRFGTISIRELVNKALPLNETFLNELIWRDFYAQILFNFPHVAKGSFRNNYDKIQWRNNEIEFEKWKQGLTGYPLVDAGMRELNETGFMHNRVRMLTASFLTKHLLIDWRWGEAYFAEKLLDFDLASNNGGWQWAAGCGTDAAPYFRIFSPEAQMLKFDANLKYIKKWVPEYGTIKYVKPIVDHKEAKILCLAAYQAALKNDE